MDTNSLPGLLTEVLTLVGLVGGAVLYLAGLALAGIKGRWIPADGVVASSGSGPVIRWFDRFGEVHECAADTHETLGLRPGDDVPVWFHSRVPSQCRTDTPETEGKALRLVGLILLGTGALSAATGFVLMFV